MFTEKNVKGMRERTSEMIKEWQHGLTKIEPMST